MLTRILTDAFNALTPNHRDIYQSAQGYSVQNWTVRQQAQAGVAGGVSCLIPVWGLLALPADVAFLLNRMAVTVYGIGAIIGAQAGRGFILEEEDLAVVLARWTGDDELADAAVAKVTAGLVTKVGTKAAGVLAKTVAEKGCLLMGKKLGGKLGAKLAAKFGAKLGTKLAGNLIPLVGAGVGAGVNAYFVGSIAEAAEGWYRLKTAVPSAAGPTDAVPVTVQSEV